MTETLRGKENLTESNWVREQTKSALSDLKKSIKPVGIIEERDGNLRFDGSTSKNYLMTLKDKKTYEEVMEKNSGATIMSVQVLLKKLGYNAGNIDGILKDKGKTTSKTMEAIKEFQRHNGLTPNGLPGPKTINKLLVVYGEYEKKWDKYRSLLKKKSITDDEMKFVIKFQKDYYDLDIEKHFCEFELTSITDNQAEILGKERYVELDGLKTLTDKQVKLLGKVRNIISLDGLTSLSDKQAELLVGNKTRTASFRGITEKNYMRTAKNITGISLNNIRQITDRQATLFSKLNFVDLDGLRSITDKQLELLSRTEALSLGGIKRLTYDQIKILSKVLFLKLNGLATLTDNQVELLSSGKVMDLELNGLTTLTDRQAELLSSGKIKNLELDGLTKITDKQVKLLSRISGNVRINRKILTDKQKQLLGYSF